MNEFDVIQKYFRPLSEGHDDFCDDAAVLKIPGDHELVVTSDALILGTHIVPEAAPEDIAHKALRRNLSDLAAMGARPLAYQLNIAFSERPRDSWLSAFASALLRDQKEFGIYCSGGDTTSTDGPLSVNIAALGLVPAGRAIHRRGAKPGDDIFLTGPVGDAYIGLQVLQKKIKTRDDDFFTKAALRPMPRTGIINIIHDRVSAAIDISDGLVADLGHVCTASGCGAEISLPPGIFSEAAHRVALSPEELLTGGDDYELLLAVPPGEGANLLRDLSAAGLDPIQIGRFTQKPGIKIHDHNGRPITPKTGGWTHF